MDPVGVGVVEEGQEQEVFCVTFEFPVTRALAHTSFCSICIAQDSFFFSLHFLSSFLFKTYHPSMLK